MTQIQTQIPSRGTSQHAGGAYSGDCIQDINDGDALQGPIISLTGTTDALNPHKSGNYMIQSSVADAVTLTAPTAGADDNVSIALFVDSTGLAHTLTATSLLAAGVALKTTVTFGQFKGAGIVLRAFNGVWQVVSQTVAPLT